MAAWLPEQMLVHFYRGRFRTLNRHLVAPVLRDAPDESPESAQALASVAVDLGRTRLRLDMLAAPSGGPAA